MKQTPELIEVQKKLAPGVLTLKGFLGDDSRDLAEIIGTDQQTLSIHGVTHSVLSAALRNLTVRGTDLMEGEVCLDDRFLVRVRDDRGRIPCPWRDGMFTKDDTEMRDQVTGKTFRWNSLSLHLIEVHGFYMGIGSDYRIDPEDLIVALGLDQSETPDDPKWSALVSRRSVRSYSPRPVPESQIKRLLQAAMSAPSAGNRQPWRFIVIRERALLDRVAELHPDRRLLGQTAVAVLVCGDTRLEAHPECWVQDCSAATQNILLAAHFLGLGAVWLGIHPDRERATAMQHLFGLPQEVIPLALVPIGFPMEWEAAEDRFREDKVMLNRWSSDSSAG